VAQDGDDARITIANAAMPLTPVSDTSAGMGIGLIIARTIIEAHGGALLRADRDGEVIFTVALPLVGGLA